MYLLKNIYLTSLLIVVALLIGCDEDDKKGESTKAENSEGNNAIEVSSESKDEKGVYWTDLSDKEKLERVTDLLDAYGVIDNYNIQDIITRLNDEIQPVNMELDFETVVSYSMKDLDAPKMIEQIAVNEQLGDDSYTDTLNQVDRIIEKDGTTFVFHSRPQQVAFYFSILKDNKWIVKDQLLHDHEENSMYSDEIKQAIDNSGIIGRNISRYFTNDLIIDHIYDSKRKISLIIESTFDETGITSSKIISKDYVSKFSIVTTSGGEYLFLTEEEGSSTNDLYHVNIYEDTNLSNPVYTYDVKLRNYYLMSADYLFLDKDSNYLYTGDDAITLKIDVTTGELDWDPQGELMEYKIPYTRSLFVGDVQGLVIASDPRYEQTITVARYDIDLNSMNNSTSFESDVEPFTDGAKTGNELHIWREVEFKQQKSIQKTSFLID